MTLVQFDSEDPYEVMHSFVPISSVEPLTRETFVPRATTPLLDAIGRGINDIEHCLRELPEEERPAKVVVVIITDGQENASHEFSKAQIEKMISAKQKEKDWQFVYLSADLNAFNDAAAYGVRQGSTLKFSRTMRGTQAVWESASERIADYRTSRTPSVAFQDEDHKKQEEADGHEA